MSWTKIDADVALEIAGEEAIVREAYLDSVGVWTWSIGVTSATGHDVHPRYLDKPASIERCLEVYIWALEKFAEDVRREFAGTELTKEEFTGILSFTWNVGPGWLKKATWVNRFKTGDKRGAREAFLWFDKPPEIKARRKREAELIFDGKWHNKDSGLITEYKVHPRSHTPDWGSAKRIPARAAMEIAISGKLPVPVEPPVPVPLPTKPPVVKPRMKQVGIITLAAAVASAITAYSNGEDPGAAVTNFFETAGICEPATTEN